jgi:hypothetical protein
MEPGLKCLDRLSIGEIDIMVDVAYSYEREMLYDFNFQSLFTNWGMIYVKKQPINIYV